MKPDFPALATILFFLTTGFLFVIFISGLTRGLKAIRHTNYYGILYLTAVGILAWFTLLTFLSIKGFFADFVSMPPKLPLALIVPTAAIVFLAMNRTVGNILDTLHPNALIYPQAFRIVVEIILWLLYLDHICPEQMTFEGRNFDIIAGITAPIFGYLSFAGGRKNINLAIIWNIISLGLLLNILTVAVLSIPQVGVLTPPNTFVAYFPLVLLPGFVAPFALMLHVLSLRQLIRMKKAG